MKKERKEYFKLIKEFILLNIILLFFGVLNTYISNVCIISIENEYMRSMIKITLESGTILLGVFLFARYKGKEYVLPNDKFSICKTSKYFFISGMAALILPMSLYFLGTVELIGGIWTKFYAEDIIFLLLVGLIECTFEVIAEEVLFRAFINTMLIKYLSEIRAILFSTIYYVFIHSLDSYTTPLVLINLALLNIILSLLYFKHKNIWVCVIPRAIFEFITAYIFSMNRLGRDEIGILLMNRIEKYSFFNGGQYGAYGSVLSTIFLIAFIILFLKIQRINFKFNTIKIFELMIKIRKERG